MRRQHAFFKQPPHADQHIDGNPVHNDKSTSFANVGSGSSTSDPAAMFAYRPGKPTDTTPIRPGETVQLQSQGTGKYCKLAQLPAGLASPSTCNTQGLICDQDSIAGGATALAYTGTGLSYNGVPLVASPPSNTLVLSSDPVCTVPDGGNQLTIPPAARGASQLVNLLLFVGLLCQHMSGAHVLTVPNALL
jgi:hypothetical protein